MKQAKQQLSYYAFYNTQLDLNQGEVIVEAPVSLTVNGEVWLSFMCTPIDLDALAVGFLYNEGLINSISEIASLRVCPGNDNVDVWINHKVEKPNQWNRTSGCTGGITSINVDNVLKKSPHPVAERDFLCPQDVYSLIGQLFEAQDLYKSVGGVHTSALSNGKDILITAEDIGRHNTLDKLSGKRLLSNMNIEAPVCITTGRISSEMLQKAKRMGAIIVISRTSPSSLSIEMADRSGITMIGYARHDRFNVYTHHERILVGTPCLDFKVSELYN